VIESSLLAIWQVLEEESVQISEVGQEELVGERAS
jgi:hypothetical protein